MGERSLNLLQGLASYLERETAAIVHHESSHSYDRFAVLAATGRFDIVLVPAHLGYVLMKDYGFQPLAGTSETFRDVVITASSSGIEGLEGLRGGELATPGGQSTTTVVLRGQLRSLGLMDVKLRALASHPDVVMAVLRGDYAAGVVSDRVLETLTTEFRSSLSVIWQGPSITRGTFVASANRSPDEVAHLRGLLLDWLKTDSAEETFSRFKPASISLAPLRVEDLASLEAYSSDLRALLRSNNAPILPR